MKPEIEFDERSQPFISSKMIEDYELAGNLLLNEGENCWDLNGYSTFLDDGTPIFEGWVTLAVANDGSYKLLSFQGEEDYIPDFMPSIQRRGLFWYHDNQWDSLYIYEENKENLSKIDIQIKD